MKAFTGLAALLLLMVAATETMASFGVVAPGYAVPHPAVFSSHGRLYRFRPWSPRGGAFAPRALPGQNQWLAPGPQYRFRPWRQPRPALRPQLAPRHAMAPAFAMGPMPGWMGFPHPYSHYAGVPHVPPMVQAGYGYPFVAPPPAVAFVPPWNRSGARPVMRPPQLAVPAGYADYLPARVAVPPPLMTRAPLHRPPVFAPGGYRFRPQPVVTGVRHVYHYEGRAWRFRPLDMPAANQRSQGLQGRPVSVTKPGPADGQVRILPLMQPTMHGQPARAVQLSVPQRPMVPFAGLVQHRHDQRAEGGTGSVQVFSPSSRWGRASHRFERAALFIQHPV